MVGDGEHISSYDPGLAEEILAEAAHLLRHLGFAAQHTILIGGLVPGLLVPDLDPARPAHIGTTDVDLCLSVALTLGDTAEYERIEAALKQADYQPTDVSFRWQRQTGLRLQVEFFCPAGEGRPAGTMFRPKAADQPTTKRNMGSSLSAIALHAGEAISADVQAIERDVTLPGEEGTVRHTFQVSGIVGFLVAKVGALVGRDKPKDAYDIVWLLEAWPGGPVGAAAAVRETPAFGREDVAEALAQLGLEFSSTDRVGPRSYVRFVTPSGASRDDADRAARQAVGAVTTFVRALHPPE